VRRGARTSFRSTSGYLFAAKIEGPAPHVSLIAAGQTRPTKAPSAVKVEDPLRPGPMAAAPPKGRWRPRLITAALAIGLRMAGASLIMHGLTSSEAEVLTMMSAPSLTVLAVRRIKQYGAAGGSRHACRRRGC
jgi:hypothetical protein